MFFNFCLSVHAATYLSWGSKSAFVRVRNYTNSCNKIWSNVLDRGRSSWNTSAANVTFSTDTTNNNRIYVQFEIWHVFWLDDNPSSGNSSLMNHSRNREIIYVPQSSDIKNVNAKY